MIIGIGGVSRSGKTTLANQLSGKLKGKAIKILHQDDFALKSNLPMIRNHPDWEIPSSIDWPSWKSEINRIRSQVDILILEGIFAFYDQSMNDTMSHRFFVSITKEIFYKRKRNDLRWGREPDWFIDHIWASFVKYGQVGQCIDPYILLNGEKPFNIELILQTMHSLNQGF